MQEDQDQVISDQRRFRRFGVVAVARVASELDIETSATAQVLNISKGGMYIETDLDIAQGRTVYFWLDASTAQTKRKKFTGRVQWKKTQNDPYSAIYGYGIKFNDSKGPSS